MDAIDLHKFVGDLGKRPAKGSNQPPVGIRAKDLDDNYRKVTLISSPDGASRYKVQYTPDGVYLIDTSLPDGTNDGDLLYWDDGSWVVLSAPNDATLRVLTIQSGTLAWTATEDCEE